MRLRDVYKAHRAGNAAADEWMRAVEDQERRLRRLEQLVEQIDQAVVALIEEIRSRD